MKNLALAEPSEPAEMGLSTTAGAGEMGEGRQEKATASPRPAKNDCAANGHSCAGHVQGGQRSGRSGSTLPKGGAKRWAARPRPAK